jgi:pantoate--beta-alanine ligase
MRRARAECGAVVVSLFVNPTQFGPHEDLNRYPRDPDRDCALAEEEGVDYLFAPAVEEVYPAGFRTAVNVEGPLAERLEGASRPGHLRGVATVVAKLFNMAPADRAYFGEKDRQQLQVIRRLARDLDFPIEIVACPTVREADGLAMSSRNRYLLPEERAAALSLSRGLFRARELFEVGERRAAPLAGAVRRALEAEPLVRPDYVELADQEEWVPVEVVWAPTVLAVAARVGGTRLIDNVLLSPDDPS